MTKQIGIVIGSGALPLRAALEILTGKSVVAIESNKEFNKSAEILPQVHILNNAADDYYKKKLKERGLENMLSIPKPEFNNGKNRKQRRKEQRKK